MGFSKLTQGQKWYREEYITSKNFKRLRVMVVDRKCFICDRLDTILPHHITYRRLGEERLWRDIYPICFDCHTQIHFVRFFWIFQIKIPNKRFILKKRMFYLRAKYCVQNKRYSSALWAFIRYNIG